MIKPVLVHRQFQTRGARIDHTTKQASRRLGQYETWLGALLVPARQGDCFFDVLEFGQKELRNRLLQPALFGPEALLSVELGVRTAEEENALVFRQGEDHRDTTAMLEVHADGTLVFGAVLRHKTDKFTSLAGSYIINEDDVERRLTAFATYASQFYQGLQRGDLISNLYFGTSLTGLEHKTFGRLSSHPLSSFTVPMHGLPSPMKVPDPPLRISRADLANPATIAQKMTGHIARTFRNANAYYTSDGGRGTS